MKTAVVTLSVGRAGAELLAISGPLMRRFAARVGAAFHVYRVERSPFPCGEKFRVRTAVEHYDRVFYADADVLLDPARCPDPFAAVPETHVGAFNERATLLRAGAALPGTARPNADGLGWVREGVAALCRSQGLPPPADVRAYNSGVLVLSRRHAGFFDPPAGPYPPHHCSEQWYSWNVNVPRHGYPVFDLPEAWNRMWWVTRSLPSFRAAPDVHVRHFAGMFPVNGSSHARRLDLMRTMAAELAGEPATSATRDGRRCAHLGRRTEFRAGCGGWMCRHACAKGLPAVPGGSCLTCPQFIDDGAF